MEPETAIERQTMSIEEAARLLGIGRNNAYLAARNGEIPIIKIGKRILVLKEPLKRMLEGSL
jgi:excisionase family DNA binding protein